MKKGIKRKMIHPVSPIKTNKKKTEKGQPGDSDRKQKENKSQNRKSRKRDPITERRNALCAIKRFLTSFTILENMQKRAPFRKKMFEKWQVWQRGNIGEEQYTAVRGLN